MGFKDTHKYIEQRFNTQWADATPVYYDNTKKPPESLDTFMEIDIIPGQVRGEIGDGTMRRENGGITIKAFTPQNIGKGAALTLLDTASNIFRKVEFNGISCFEPQPPVLIGDVGVWFCMAIDIDFIRFFTD